MTHRKVRDVMTVHVIAVAEKTPFRLPRRRRHANRARAAGLTVKDVMSSPVLTIGAEASVVDAARSLDRTTRHLPGDHP